jgi:hypothetical protein
MEKGSQSMKTRGWLVGWLMLAAGCAAPWEHYSSPEGGFTVDMPGPPKKETHDQKTPQGVITFNAVVANRPHASYMAAWADVPPKLPIDLDAFLKSLVKNYQGTVQEKREVELAGRPGMEFVLKTNKPQGQVAGRVYHLKDRLYELLVVGHEAGRPAEAEKFFETFKLVSPLMKPETTAHD